MRATNLMLRLPATLQIPLLSGLYPLSNNMVNLANYGKFLGTVVNETFSGYALPAPVDAWLGMEYSTQPVGENRFRPVDWPAAFAGVKSATAYGNTCIQFAESTAVDTQDESCLTFNVYRTQGVALNRRLPVLVWIHGGAFLAGSYSSFDGAAFAASSKLPLVVVTFHYRLGALGFLPSTLFKEEGLLNLGLRDQHLFLQFVQKHIASFGGDPARVTVGGRSAGGHSVGVHYFHNYADDAGKPLFAQAIHQSGSVTARNFPNASYELYRKQFSKFMAYLGCDTNVPSTDQMACLRSANVDEIRNIGIALYEEYNPTVTWPFQPAQGGPLLEKFGSKSGLDGTFFHVPVISSTVSDEGKLYMPGNLETNKDFLDYIQTGSPGLNSTDLELLQVLYPDPLTDTSSPFVNSPNSTQYNRLSAAWSDYGYICPGQETACRTSAAGVPTWKLRFNTPNFAPLWKGIPHTSDTKYTWNEPSTEYPEVSRIYHAYLSSFVATGDPNAYRYAGSPEWPNYEPSGYGLDSTPALQLAVHPNGTVVEKDDIRRAGCLFWRDPERASRLNK